MKRIFSLLILLFFIVNGFSQTISGSWKGTLAFGQQKLAIVLHIQTDQNGKTTCLMGIVRTRAQKAFQLFWIPSQKILSV